MVVRQLAEAHMFYIYVIYNALHRKLYIGQTDNIQRRILEHNNSTSERHTYTKRFDGTWSLVYQEEAYNRKQALVREKQLKSYRGRQFIKQFIPG